MENNSVETRDDQITRVYLEGNSVKQVAESVIKNHGPISHERVRQVLMARGIVLRKPGPITSKTPRSFGRLTTKERLITSVTVIKDHAFGDHWVWPHRIKTGRKGRYGHFGIKGRVLYAHRAAWYLVKGRLPIGRLRKKCAIHNCIHPDHWKEKNPPSS